MSALWSMGLSVFGYEVFLKGPDDGLRLRQRWTAMRLVGKPESRNVFRKHKDV
jgi:hypothetical protein